MHPGLIEVYVDRNNKLHALNTTVEMGSCRFEEKKLSVK